MRNRIAAIAATAVVVVASVAAAQSYVGPTIAIKPNLTGSAITAVTPTAACGQPLKVSVTIKGSNAVPSEGTIVIGGAARYTAPYKIAVGQTATIIVPTTASVTCTASGAAIPSAAVWLEPTTGGSDAMMWTLKPSTINFTTAKQSIPG